MAKSDRLEAARRVETVRLSLLAGATYSVICRQLSEKWECSYRQVERYLRQAKAQITEYAREDDDYLFADHLSFRRLIRLREYEAGNYQGALSAARDEAKLLGLYAPEEHDWRIVLEKYGLDPAREFEAIARFAAARLAPGLPASGSGSMAGSSQTGESDPD